jgi:HEXXH motif-containing protein
VPVVDGAVHLPGLGRLVIKAAAGAPPDARLRWASLETDQDWVRVRVGADALRLPRPSLLADAPVQAGPGPAPAGGPSRTSVGAAGGMRVTWEPVRVLTAPGIRVTFEDAGAYHDGLQPTRADRTTEAEFGRWQRDFALAWQQIQSNHAAYGPALAAGLAVLTPRAARPGAAQDVGSAQGAAQDVGSAQGKVYGAVETVLPASPTALALALIREFQHAKLSAVLELFELHDPADKRSYRAPWQAETGPFEWLLSGAYANLAVTEFWRARAGLGESDHAEARHRYECWRAYTVEAIETLTGSNSLTPLGDRFVEGMRIGISGDGTASRTR